ncbi:MAG: hypothetical protein M1840_001739 [Geoglossum simile]|nr:MAG: hypothetical protein M1840_001739 [Geoglossum simile]
MSSSSMSSAAPGSVEGFYDFDPDGDLDLILTALPGDGLPGHTGDIRCRVSSKHLSLVSPVFEAMLQRQFKEAATLRSVGKVEIPLADDNPVAFMILLEIIHGCTRSIPRAITLDMLTEAAVLVDKYDCREVVEQYSDMWIYRLKGRMPLTLESALQWLCVSWVFRKSIEFKHATEIAIRSETLGDMMDGLPVPSSVLGGSAKDSTSRLGLISINRCDREN